MMQRISPKIWVPVITVALLAVGLAIFFSWPREEKTPEIVAPEVTLEKEITPPEGIVWNVPAGQVNPETEKEIKKAVYATPYFISAGKELEAQGEFFSIETVKAEGEWAVVGYATRYKDTGEFVPAGPATLVLRKINENWERAGSKERLCQWLSVMPDTSFFSELKVFYEGLCEK